MKKALPLLLALVLCLSLCACGRSSVKQKASTAPYLDLTTYFLTENENEAKAEAEYDGNIYRYTGIVVEIDSDYCAVGYYNMSGEPVYQMYVHLAKEDLVMLSTGETYTFAGEFESNVLLPDLRNAVIVE